MISIFSSFVYLPASSLIYVHIIKDISSIEIRTVMDQLEIDSLGRGQTRLLVEPSGHPKRRLTGLIVPRYGRHLVKKRGGGRGVRYLPPPLPPCIFHFAYGQQV